VRTKINQWLNLNGLQAESMSDEEKQLRQELSMKFRSLCHRTGLTDPQLAAICGVKPDTVKTWKNKNSSALPNHMYLDWLSENTGVQFRTVFGELSGETNSEE